MNSILGFTAQDTSPGTSFTGTNIFNMGYPPFIYFYIYTFGVGYNSTNSTLLATWALPINVNKGEIIEYNDKTSYDQIIDINQKTIYNINIIMRDSQGNLIETNGSNYNMILYLC